MKEQYIAIVYEGDSTEEQLFRNIKKNFFDDKVNMVLVSFPAGQNIYMLWKMLDNDSYETDFIEVLREYNPLAKKALEDYTRTDFSEIYLFFDYDGHNNNLGKGIDSDVIMVKMLETFDNETEYGKLYISYPMVESLRDHLRTDTCFRRCSVPAKEVIHYKNLVGSMIDFQNFNKIDIEDWKVLCSNTIKKANCILNKKYELPSRKSFINDFLQSKIFWEQYKKYIQPYNRIAVLNAFPIFLLEYFREDFWNTMLSL